MPHMDDMESTLGRMVAHACDCGSVHLPPDADPDSATPTESFPVEDAQGNPVHLLPVPVTDLPHPVIDRLGIVPVYREDKIDGSDVASITYEEACRLADRVREETLEEAGNAIARLGYVTQTESAFPSQRALDQWAVLDALQELAARG